MTRGLREPPVHQEFAVSPEGLFFCAGAGAELVQTLDAQIRMAAHAAGAEEYRFPTIIAKQTLQRADYFQSFPDYALSVKHPVQGDYFLTPAACYHCYELLADSVTSHSVTNHSITNHSITNRSITNQGALMTCCSRCFRADKPDQSHLLEFTMREVVFIGGRGEAVEWRASWMQRVERWMNHLGLKSELVPASDHFFGEETRGKKLLQQIKKLKYELRVGDISGSAMAIASFNLHEQFFTSRFGISLADNRPAHSACVAFGLERWAMALTARYGMQETIQRVETMQ